MQPAKREQGSRNGWVVGKLAAVRNINNGIVFLAAVLPTRDQALLNQPKTPLRVLLQVRNHNGQAQTRIVR